MVSKGEGGEFLGGWWGLWFWVWFLIVYEGMEVMGIRDRLGLFDFGWVVW